MIEYTVKVHDSGTRSWFVNGQLHREDGPAIEYADGTRSWYVNGQSMTQQEFLKRNAPCAGREVEIDGIKYRLTAV